MSGAVGLHGMHKDNVMCSFHSLFCQDCMVVMAAEVLKVLLLNGCSFFFISFYCTYVSIHLWSETVLLIIRCVNCLSCVVNMWVVCWFATISYNAKIIVDGWHKFFMALLLKAHSYCVCCASTSVPWVCVNDI
jgi:hypothetical protein